MPAQKRSRGEEEEDEEEYEEDCLSAQQQQKLQHEQEPDAGRLSNLIFSQLQIHHGVNRGERLEKPMSQLLFFLISLQSVFLRF